MTPQQEVEQKAVKLYDQMSQAMFEIHDEGATIHNAGEVIGWLVDALTQRERETAERCAGIAEKYPTHWDSTSEIANIARYHSNRIATAIRQEWG